MNTMYFTCLIRASLKSRLTIAVCTGFAVFGISLTQVFGASFMGLGDLPGGEFRSDATAVSANGEVVVGQSDSALGHEGFRWTRSDGMTWTRRSAQ